MLLLNGCKRITAGLTIALAHAFIPAVFAAPQQMKSDNRRDELFHEPAADVGAADLEALDAMLECWAAGGKVCQKEYDRVSGSRIARQPCVKGGDITKAMWQELYKARSRLIEQIKLNAK